jgi:uncharacterized protein YraI
MIKLDHTQVSTVATCTECSSWCQVRSSKTAAWAAGADHQANVHPGSDQAAAALHASQRKARRAG